MPHAARCTGRWCRLAALPAWFGKQLRLTGLENMDDNPATTNSGLAAGVLRHQALMCNQACELVSR